MEHVVYILGAGFSAPLGIPVISNFLEKSKDQFFSNQATFPRFRDVFTNINNLARAKNIYQADLHNIEEILSIFEMEGVGKDFHQNVRKDFVDYIGDVVRYHTPPPQPAPLGSHRMWNISGVREPWTDYCAFVAAISGLRFVRTSGAPHAGIGYAVEPQSNEHRQYAVITLNYDVVLETAAALISKQLGIPLQFHRDPALLDNTELNGALLAKLHGSIDTNDIVPPTWNKTFAGDEPNLDWRLAYELLARANHIRLIGYSLPSADSYIRYLLKAAAVRTEHLKSIDVMCLDPFSDVQARYREFIAHPKYRFRKRNVSDYLKSMHNVVPEQFPKTYDPWISLEAVHETIFS